MPHCSLHTFHCSILFAYMFVKKIRKKLNQSKKKSLELSAHEWIEAQVLEEKINFEKSSTRPVFETAIKFANGGNKWRKMLDNKKQSKKTDKNKNRKIKV